MNEGGRRGQEEEKRGSDEEREKECEEGEEGEGWWREISLSTMEVMG